MADTDRRRRYLLNSYMAFGADNESLYRPDYNFFDISTAVPGYLNYNGSAVNPPDKGNMVSGFIKVLPNTRYIFTIYPTTEEAKWIGYCLYSSNIPGLGSINNRRTVVQDQNYCIIETGNARYIRIGARYLDNGGNATLKLYRE